MKQMLICVSVLVGMAMAFTGCRSLPRQICSRPDPMIIDELLSPDAELRRLANIKVREAIQADMYAELDERLAHISYIRGTLLEDVRRVIPRLHGEPLRDFVIRSAAACGWWPQDVDRRTIRCTVYKWDGFGPTLLQCIVDIVCYDDQTIGIIFVQHEYNTDFESRHVRELYRYLTGRELQVPLEGVRARPF